MKKLKKILIIIFLILIILFFISYPSIKKKFDYNKIDTRAVSEITSINLTLHFYENTGIPESGNVSFTLDDISDIIAHISGLTEGYSINVTIPTDNFPGDWSEQIPTSDEITQSFKHFELNASENATGSFRMDFNLPQSKLGSTDAEDIRLFLFNPINSSWMELSVGIVTFIL